MYLYVKRLVACLVLFLSFNTFCSAQTLEEKELLGKAQEYKFRNMKGVIRTCKSAWAVLERGEHSGVSSNKKIYDALCDCWRTSYALDDSSRSVKITRQNMMDIFQTNLKAVNPHLSYSQKSAALRDMYAAAHEFVRNHMQVEFRETVQKAQKLIQKNLKPYISASTSRERVSETEIFKTSMRFLLLVLINKQKPIDSNDEKFITAKIDMFVREMGHQYPYISAVQFESWMFSLLQDLFFGECVVCMDSRSEIFMPCCKSKNMCRGCYARVSRCPLCRASKPSYR